MKYSIIVPIYKIERYLTDCIESVLRQTYSDYELILVDDGSPDNCPHICDEYASKDSRIKVIHKENGGLVSARKAGLVIATGEYVMCLDGDDFINDNCLEIIDSVLNKYHTEVICFGYNIYTQNKEIPFPVYCPYYGYYSRKEIETSILPHLIHTKTEKRFPPVIWSKVFRMDVYKKYQNKVSSEISMGEDGACSYPLISNCQSMFIMEECLYYYRQVQTSLTKIRKPLSWDNYDKVFKIYEKEIEIDKYDLRSQIYRAKTHNLFNLCKSQFYSGDKYSIVVNQIKKRFSEHPEYDAAIQGSDFSSLQMKLARFSLLHRLYPLIYLYSKLK